MAREVRDIKSARSLESDSRADKIAGLVGRADSVLIVGRIEERIGSLLDDGMRRITAIVTSAQEASEAGVYCADVEVVDTEAGLKALHARERAFDAILFDSSLSSGTKLGIVLTHAKVLLKPGGALIVVLSNIAHGAIRLSALRGAFDFELLGESYRNARTLQSSQAAFMGAGYQIKKLERVLHPIFERFADLPELSRDDLAPETLQKIEQDPEANTLQFVVEAVAMDERSAEREIALRLRSGENEVIAANRALEKQRAELDSMQTAVEDTARRLAALEAALRDRQEPEASAQDDDLVMRLRAEIVSLGTTIGRLNEEREHILPELEASRNRIVDLENNAAELRAANDSRKTHVALLKGELESLTKSRAQIAAALDEHRIALEALTAQKAGLLSENGELRAELEARRSRIVELEGRANELAEAVEALTRSHALAAAEFDAERERGAHLEDVAAELRSTNETLAAQVAELLEERAAVERNVTGLKHAVETRKAHIDVLNSELDSLSESQARVVRELDIQEARVRESEEVAGELRVTVDSLSSELGGLLEQRDRLTRELESIVSASETLRSELDAERERSAGLELLSEGRRSAIGALSEALGELALDRPVTAYAVEQALGNVVAPQSDAPRVRAAIEALSADVFALTSAMAALIDSRARRPASEELHARIAHLTEEATQTAVVLEALRTRVAVLQASESDAAALADAHRLAVDELNAERERGDRLATELEDAVQVFAIADGLRNRIAVLEAKEAELLASIESGAASVAAIEADVAELAGAYARAVEQLDAERERGDRLQTSLVEAEALRERMMEERETQRAEYEQNAKLARFHAGSQVRAISRLQSQLANERSIFQQETARMAELRAHFESTEARLEGELRRVQVELESLSTSEKELRHELGIRTEELIASTQVEIAEITTLVDTVQSSRFWKLKSWFKRLRAQALGF